MTGVLGYLAARSLRESRPAPGDEARPQPSVRPRLPSFYEATEEREPRNAPILVEEETASSEQATKPRATRTAAATFPESAQTAVEAVAPPQSEGPSASPLPPRRHGETVVAQTREFPDAPPRIGEPQERRSGDAIPTEPERGAPKALPHPVALDMAPTVVTPRAPPPERQVSRSPTMIDAAPANLPPPVAPPALIRPRGDADADRPSRSAETRGQALIPKIDAPRESLRQPQNRPPAPPREPLAVPRVQVTIGRIEIRAAYAPAPPTPAPRPKPAMSLDDYLAKREQGRGGA